MKNKTKEHLLNRFIIIKDKKYSLFYIHFPYKPLERIIKKFSLFLSWSFLYQELEVQNLQIQ